MPPVRVALLVPDRIIRSGIEGLIKQDGTTVYSVITFEDFEVCLYQSEGIDILLMDISGLQMHEIEERFTQMSQVLSSVRTIVISNRLSAVFIHRIMQLGANGYIYRDELADALLNSLDLVRRDVATLSPQASQLFINSKYLNILKDVKPLDMQILRLTAKGLSVKAIAAKLQLSIRSIYRSRDKVRAILGIQNIESLVDGAREQGLLDLEDE